MTEFSAPRGYRVWIYYANTTTQQQFDSYDTAVDYAERMINVGAEIADVQDLDDNRILLTLRTQ